MAVWDPKTRRWDRYGVIVERQPYRRYLVRLASRKVMARNRRHLRHRYGHALPDITPSMSAMSRHLSQNQEQVCPRSTQAPPQAAPQASASTHDRTRTPQAPPASREDGIEPVQSPRLPRRSQRTLSRPQRLIEEM